MKFNEFDFDSQECIIISALSGNVGLLSRNTFSMVYNPYTIRVKLVYDLLISGNTGPQVAERLMRVSERLRARE